MGRARVAQSLERALRQETQTPFGFRWRGKPYMVMPRRLYTVADVLYLEAFDDDEGLISVPIDGMTAFLTEYDFGAG